MDRGNVVKPNDELVDIIDTDGNVVAVVTRAEMRANRLPHRCVYLLVFNFKGEIFIHQRTATKDVYPSYWDMTIGGVLAAGESFDEGAVREGCEELGVEHLAPQALFPMRYADQHSVVHGMAYRTTHDGPFQLQSEEIVCGEFVAVDALQLRIARQNYCPDGLAVWREYLDRKTG